MSTPKSAQKVRMKELERLVCFKKAELDLLYFDYKSKEAEITRIEQQIMRLKRLMKINN